MTDSIRDGLADAVEPGWVVAFYVAVATYQRIDGDGEIESATIAYTPTGQPPYLSKYLLDSVNGEPAS